MEELNSVEVRLFLEGLFLQYGYDFREYASASMNRRLQNLLMKSGLQSLIDLLKLVLQSREKFLEILPELTINTTEFFRDPLFFKALKSEVFPILKTYPSINIWVAGCSSGEEVISLSILLHEADLLHRTTIYATDISPAILKRAKEGIYATDTIQLFNRNYVAAGGARSPSEYYTADYGLVRMDPFLKQSVVFSEHNLASDSHFIDCHLILCRNVLIYFNRELQNRVLELLAHSLVHRGILAIGPKESIKYSVAGKWFDPVTPTQNIFSLRLDPVGASKIKK